MNLVPIDTGVKTLQINPTSNVVKPEPSGDVKPAATTSQVELTFPTDLPEMKAGEKKMVPVMVKSTGVFRSAVFGVRFDDKKLAVRSVLFGDVFGMGLANTAAKPLVNEGGKMFVSLSAADKAVATTDGVLAFIEIEALVDGKPAFTVEKDALNFMGLDGRNLLVAKY